VLGPSATFGDLVRTARLLAERGQRDSSSACMLRGAGGGYVLEADLMPAISGASEAPSELDARLQEGGRVAALTAFGVHGDATAPNALEAWTAVAPERLSTSFVLLALTDEGVYLRAEPPRPSASTAALTLDAVAAALGATQAEGAPATCYVTAEPEVALEQLAQLLSRVPASCQAVLGTLLPAGTKLPAPPTAVEPPRCPEGLPELPAIAVEGELPVPVLRQGLSAVSPGALRCLQYAPAVAAAGISIDLALRINPRGLVDRVCVLESSVTNVPFETCVLEAARNARFDPPSPAGYVDVHAPLSLVAERWPVQRGFCGE
jgi:TonB family protein